MTAGLRWTNAGVTKTPAITAVVTPVAGGATTWTASMTYAMVKTSVSMVIRLHPVVCVIPKASWKIDSGDADPA